MAVKFVKLRPDAGKDDVVRAYNDMVLKLEVLIVALEKENKRLADELATEIQQVRQEIEGHGAVNSKIESLETRVSSLEGYHSGNSSGGIM